MFLGSLLLLSHFCHKSRTSNMGIIFPWRLAILLSFLLFSQANYFQALAQKCKPSGVLKGKKPPHSACNTDHDSECCKPGKLYQTYECSPPVSNHTKAILTINSFEKGRDGGGPSACDGKFHKDNIPIVALSTGWFNKRKRCQRHIRISGNGRSVVAKVVDECDSAMGCDKDHDFQPPCPNDVVDASEAIWKALGVKESEWGWMHVTWTDA